MKKILIPITILLLCIILTGCNTTTKKSDKIQIVCTTFPQYDWVREIIKTNEDLFDVTLLLNNKVDLHNYKPTAKDIITIQNANLFIYIGGDSDAWVDDLDLSKVNTLKLIDKLPSDKLLENNHLNEREEHKHDEDCVYDEHIWLSLENAKILVNIISEEITKINNEEIYNNNANNYIAKLNNLNENFKNTLKNCNKNTLVFADRFPFSYLLKDYNINHTAAFDGCSAESEVDFNVVTDLVKSIDENNLEYVIILEKSDKSLANTVINETKNKNQKIIEVNAMQSVDINNTYLEIMEKNLEIFELILK